MATEELEIQARNRYKTDLKNRKWFGHVQLKNGVWITIEDVVISGQLQHRTYKGEEPINSAPAQHIIAIAQEQHPFAFLECDKVLTVVFSDFFTPLLTKEQREAIRDSALDVPLKNKKIDWKQLTPFLFSCNEEAATRK